MKLPSLEVRGYKVLFKKKRLGSLTYDRSFYLLDHALDALAVSQVRLHLVSRKNGGRFAGD